MGVLIKDPLAAVVSGVVGLAIVGASFGLQTHWAKRRWPQLAPKRTRLARLHLDVTEIRSELKRQDPDTVELGMWEPRIRAFDSRFWERLAEIEPDDWRREKLKIRDFEVVTTNGRGRPARWALAMRTHLQVLRTLVEERMDKYPLE